MKKPKTIVTKVVLGTVTSSILVASCSKEYNFEDNIYGGFAENTATKGMVMLDITKSNLS